MTLFFAFLRANWLSIICAVAVLIVLGYITILKSQLNASMARESALLVNIHAKELEIRQWNDIVTIQNASIDKMAKDTAAAKAKGLKAAKVAQELKAKAAKDIAGMSAKFNAIAPSDNCADVERVFGEFK